MNYSIIRVILLIISITAVFGSDCKSAVVDTLRLIDTTFIPVPVDSMKFVISEVEWDGEQPWFIKNSGSILGSTIGALLGALGAFIVAIFSINKSHTKTAEHAQKSAERKYCGTLFLMAGEIRNHEQKTKALRKVIKRFVNVTKQQQKILTDEPFNTYEVGLLKTCLNRVMDYDDFNTILISDVSALINRTVNMNGYLSLGRLREFYESYSGNPSQLTDAIDAYFKSVHKELSGVQAIRERLIKELLEEINSKPTSFINVDEELKKLYS